MSNSSNENKNFFKENTNGVSVVDYEKIKDNLGGNEHLLITIIKSFLEDVHSILEELESLLNKKQFSEFESKAHTYKGMLCNLEAKNLIELCADLETLAKQQESEQMLKTLNQLHSGTSHLIKELEGYLKFAA